ncbi:MAG: CxxxxCH/CxxCH domain-containing protein [Deltaproteobacteria bacterium]|nr:CxxxxCH/CxxCH domain-containing protein [Deltaproteobacteria bacterium]
MRRENRPLHVLFVLLTPFVGCGKLRPAVEDPAATISYRLQIQPLLRTHCVSCHGAERQAGNYRLDSWRALFAAGSDDTANVVAGDSRSRLVTVLSDSDHQALLSIEQKLLLWRWVVSERAAFGRSSVHPRNWLNASDRDAVDFHGGVIRRAQWSLEACQQCHGADLNGRGQASSCYGCHPKGPIASCDTCHGEREDPLPIPDLSGRRRSDGVGAHRLHAMTTVTEPIDCSACHRVPSDVYARDHLIDSVSGQTDYRAEVAFSRRASNGRATGFDRQSLSCTVYCHGNASIRWTSTPAAGCDGCHRAIAHPTPIGDQVCSRCHRQTVADCQVGSEGCRQIAGVFQRIADPALHIDGKVQLGAADDCASCHGTPESGGAPAPDLSGRTAISEVTVGLHRIHVTDGPLRDGLPCSTCHPVPTHRDSPGHLGDAPAEVVFDGLARGLRRDKDAPDNVRWNRQSATCSNVYCHSRPKGKVGAVWKWTEPRSGGLVCNDCHKGKADYPLHYCKVCHPAAYRDGQLNPSTHINGRLDFY